MAEPTTHRQRFGSADAEAFTAELQNQKTKQATKYSVKVLQDYMSEKNIDEPIKTLAINDLNNLLADFFANVRNLEGEVRLL
jgi:peptidoglycan hydrolase-like protein with peptidoglycan-binding domain